MRLRECRLLCRPCQGGSARRHDGSPSGCSSICASSATTRSTWSRCRGVLASRRTAGCLSAGTGSAGTRRILWRRNRIHSQIRSRTQRSAAVTDEVVLLPLTETPVEEETLAAINARLTGERLAGSEEMIEQTVRATGVTVFPGWELYAPAAGATETFLRSAARTPPSCSTSPTRLNETHDTLVDEGHGNARAQSGRQSGSARGSLPRAGTVAASASSSSPVIAVEQLGIEDERRARTSDSANPADDALPRFRCCDDGRSRAG